MIDIEQLAKEGKLFDGRYKLLKTLSTDGGTADVWLAIDINTIDNPDLIGEDVANISPDESGMMVAIKIYRPKNALDIEGEQRFRDEYKIVHNCRHTNLLQPTNFSICEDTPYLELPYCKNGSSELLIGKQMDEKDMWKFIFDVSSGLSYLHACSPQIIHQDIKPANVLIDDYLNFAITDFGISSQSNGKHGFYYDECNSGTMAYMAPERFEENYKPMAESDIWAFGATLYEILTGEVPYKEEGGKNQLEKRCSIKPMGNSIPKKIQKLILSCLSLNPKKRPTANQIIKLSEKQQNSSSNIIKYVTAIVCISLILGGYFFLNIDSQSPSKPTSPISIEEKYEKAILLLDSDTPEDVKHGVNILDSLANSNYIPAMYQLAKTFGWYSDSISLKRKRMLNIEYRQEEGLLQYIPVLDLYNDRARELFSKILESQDSIDPKIKADAAYRLAAYCGNENGIYKQDFVKAKQYLQKALEYAIEGNDLTMQNRIERQLKAIDKKINTKY